MSVQQSGLRSGHCGLWLDHQANSLVPSQCRDETGNVIAGGVFAENSNYPAPFGGAYLYGDTGSGWVHVLTMDGSNHVTARYDFDDAGSPVTFGRGPDGDVYVANHYGGVPLLPVSVRIHKRFDSGANYIFHLSSVRCRIKESGGAETGTAALIVCRPSISFAVSTRRYY